MRSLHLTALWLLLFSSFALAQNGLTTDTLSDDEIQRSAGFVSTLTAFLPKPILLAIYTVNPPLAVSDTRNIETRETEIIRRASEAEIFERKGHPELAERARVRLEEELRRLEEISRREMPEEERVRLRDAHIRIHAHLQRLSERIVRDDDINNDRNIDRIERAREGVRRHIEDTDRKLPNEKRINVLREMEKRKLIASYNSMIERFYKIAVYAERSNVIIRENKYAGIREDLFNLMREFERAILADNLDIARDALKKIDDLLAKVIDMVESAYPERRAELDKIVVTKGENRGRIIVRDQERGNYRIVEPIAARAR